jgi:transposase
MNACRSLSENKRRASLMRSGSTTLKMQYSEDLCKKIVAALERGMSKAEATRLFEVSLSSVKRNARIASQGESLKPRQSPGRLRKADEKARVLLEKDVEERPSATIPQRRRFLEHITGMTLSDSTVRRSMAMA